MHGERARGPHTGSPRKSNHVKPITPSQIKSNQIKSNQIKSNQVKRNQLTHRSAVVVARAHVEEQDQQRVQHRTDAKERDKAGPAAAARIHNRKCGGSSESHTTKRTRTQRRRSCFRKQPQQSITSINIPRQSCGGTAHSLRHLLLEARANQFKSNQIKFAAHAGPHSVSGTCFRKRVHR